MSVYLGRRTLRLNFSSRAIERERQNLISRKESQIDRLRKLENQVHEIQVQKINLETRIRDQDTMEQQITNWKKEMAELNSDMKVLSVLRVFASRQAKVSIRA